MSDFKKIVKDEPKKEEMKEGFIKIKMNVSAEVDDRSAAEILKEREEFNKLKRENRKEFNELLKAGVCGQKYLAAADEVVEVSSMWYEENKDRMVDYSIHLEVYQDGGKPMPYVVADAVKHGHGKEIMKRINLFERVL